MHLSSKVFILLSKFGICISKRTNPDHAEKLLGIIRSPRRVPLFRASGLGDGGYWLPEDLEGADWKVVKEFLLLPLKPRIINFEILHLSKEIRSESMEVLSGLGYQIIDRSFDRAAFHQDLIKP